MDDRASPDEAPSGDPSSHTVPVRRTPASAVQPSASGGSFSAGVGDINHVWLRRNNAFITPGTTLRSAHVRNGEESIDHLAHQVDIKDEESIDPLAHQVDIEGATDKDEFEKRYNELIKRYGIDVKNYSFNTCHFCIVLWKYIGAIK